MITKKINGGNFEPVVTGEIVLDAVPTEGSLNSVTSDGVAKAIAEGGGGSYTAGDGIDISEGEISAKVDGTTIQVNADGELEAIGGGGGGSYTAGDGITIDNGEISAVLGNSSGGMAFDNEGIAIDWSYVENSSDGTLAALEDEYGATYGIKVVNPVPDMTGASSGDVLTIGQNGPEWAAPGGSSTITAEKPIIGDGSASAPVKLLYNSNNMAASPDAYTLTVGSGTYGTVGTIEAFSTAIYEILPAPVQFEFTGIVMQGQPMTYRSYIYCPTTQARIYGNSATGVAYGGRLYASLDVKNPGEGSTGVFDGLSYQYDWEVGIEIAGAAWPFTGVTLYSASKLNVKNPLPASLGTAGQVLTVNSGATGVEWATPSGGGGVYLAAANDMAPPAQATYSDVLAAYNAGNAIYAAYHDSNNNDALYPVAPLVKYDPINGVFTFTSVEVDNQNSGDVHFHTWWLDTNGWTDYGTTK